MIYSWVNAAIFGCRARPKRLPENVFKHTQAAFGFECRLRPAWDITNLRKFRHAND